MQNYWNICNWIYLVWNFNFNPDCLLTDPCPDLLIVGVGFHWPAIRRGASSHRATAIRQGHNRSKKGSRSTIQIRSEKSDLYPKVSDPFGRIFLLLYISKFWARLGFILKVSRDLDPFTGFGSGSLDHFIRSFPALSIRHSNPRF